MILSKFRSERTCAECWRFRIHQLRLMALFLQSDVLSFEAGATKHNKMATLIKLIINNTAYS